jgi:ABC-type multidrug transport system fused ATPase/permease subunit
MTSRPDHLLWHHLRPAAGSWLAAAVVLVVGAIAGLALPLAATDVLSALTDGRELQNPVGLLVVLVAASTLLYTAGSFLLARAAERVVAITRHRLTDRLLGATLDAVREQAPGDVITRVTTDAAFVRTVSSQALVQLAVSLVSVVGALVFMATIDTFLLAVTLLVVAVPASALLVILPRVKRSARAQRAAVGNLANELDRLVGSFSAVKAAVAEDVERRRLAASIDAANGTGVRLGWWQSISAMTSSLAVQAAFLVVIAVGATRVQQGTLTVAALVGFLLYAMQLSHPVVQVTQSITTLHAGRAALERLIGLESIAQERTPPAQVRGERSNAPVRSSAPAPAIELHDVGCVRRDIEILRHVTVNIPSRGVTAVIGPSGAGKSTLLKLLVGFGEPQWGEIRIQGRPIGEWRLDELRRHVTLVEQDAPVLGGTWREALTYGVGHVDDAQLVALMRQCGLLPTDAGRSVLGRSVLGPSVLGPSVLDRSVLDRPVGYRGTSLSGGERQRVAIARALVAHPSVLALDEPSSQLDAANDVRLQALISEVGQRAAVVLVTHRASTLRAADRVIVLCGGRVRSVGTHHELLATDPLYRELVDVPAGYAGASNS